MTRTPILAALLVALAAGGVAAATNDPPSLASLVTAGQEAGDPIDDDDDRDEPATAEGESDATTTTSTTAADASTTTTMTTPTTAAPSTTAVPPPPTTTTTAAPVARPLTLRCAPTGDAKTGDDHGRRAGIVCSVEGVHERAGKLKLIRDGVVIAGTHDLSSTTFTDKDVRPGATYSYQAHTYSSDGTLLQASDAIRATAPADAAGGGEQYDGPMVMRCAGSGAKTDDHGIGCEWKGVPQGATALVLSRDGVVIARKDDPTRTGYHDTDVRPGQTYTYVLQALAADGSVVAETEPVVATAGEGA